MANFAQGIDVSRWQQTVDWASVKAAGMSFGFCKATQGVAVVDKTFAVNWPGIKAAGLARGCYHFYDPLLDPTQQAQFFLKTVKFEAGDVPAVLDVEQAGTATSDALINGCKTWLDLVEQATGRKPIIYTRASFWNEKMHTASGYPAWAADYPMWTAHYTTAAKPLVPKGWTDWTFWQFTESGKVGGVAGNVDMNRFNGAEADLFAWLGSAPAAQPKPAPVPAAAPAPAPAPQPAALNPKDIVNAYFAALNARDLDTLIALYQPGAAHITPARTVAGTDDIRAWYTDLLNQLPNGQFAVTVIKSETPLTFNWTCDSTNGHVLDGFDTIGLLNGKIQYHSAMFNIQK
jgi:GH25 family lysozyme M1 (1,4-beta-N-acetylmuramidase)